ncbi:Hypothetical protein R9X50_00633500 [Acrodontium crateriforme]|uniref:Uncharacterized protein n=1 Tax=Acrodontium crateriforme TaxID=150365 RepID=A0AAQ3M9H9_9PEZI|nr:Hypothetical protein R9X50_00633500 [Acrodontium crateriforme]
MSQSPGMSCPELSSQWLWPWQFQSPYRFILDHILVPPTGSDLPLPTIYNLSCSFGSQRSSPRTSSHSDHATESQTQEIADFTKKLEAELAKLPYQPTPRSTSYSMAKLRECFPPDLILIDASRALAGLDHLRELENARRKEVAAALRRFGVERRHLEDEYSIRGIDDQTRDWLARVETTEEQIAALYAQLHTCLRHWIFVGQLIRTFHPRKCVSLLNTLYPPFAVTQPTSTLTPAILRFQRDWLFSYITMIEHDEERALELRDPGTDSWAAVHLLLDRYINLTDENIAANLHLECIPETHKLDVAPAKGLGIQLSREDSKGNLKEYSSGQRANSVTAQLENGHGQDTASTVLNRLSLNLKAISRSTTSSPKSPKETSSPSSNSGRHGMLRKLKSMGNIGSRRASASDT